MNIFDIIGPVMVGPSSSHTAGVVRIGLVVHNIIEKCPDSALIKFHGSFARTYKGHGSDKAVTAGLMGFEASDERIRNSIEIAKERGFKVSFETIELQNAHPNTLIIEAKFEGGTCSVLGESVGGGNIIIREIDGITVEITGQYDTIIIKHIDILGEISMVTTYLTGKNINIANMRVFRSKKGGESIMIIEADGVIDKEIAKHLMKFEKIIFAAVIRGLSN